MRRTTSLLLLFLATAGLGLAQTTKGIGDARRAAGATGGSSASDDASSSGAAGTGVGASTAKGKLIVVNETATPIVVRMGEAELGQVPAGGRQEFDKIALGSRLVTVGSGGGDRRWGPLDAFVTREGAEVRIREDATSGVRLHNYTAEALVVLEGPTQVPMATVPAGAEGVFASMKPGTYKFGARSASGKLQYSARFLTVKEGALTEWTVGRAPAP